MHGAVIQNWYVLAHFGTVRHSPAHPAEVAHAWGVQALVKVPLKRTHVADSIRKARSDRPGFVDLAGFLEWLWPLTAVPERYCRELCMWLMDKLATLQMEDAMQTGRMPLPIAPPVWLGYEAPHRVLAWAPLMV